MRKVCFLILVFCLVPLLSCGPVVDPQLENQVQTESGEFETLMNNLAEHVNSIESPGDVDLTQIFPKGWLFEVYGSNESDTLEKYAIGIPISKEIGRGYGVVEPEVKKEGWVYFGRAGQMTPPTDMYIAPTWNGQPYNWGNMILHNQDMRNYPKRVALDFKKQKVMEQPYMVPPEATHGVYLETRNKLGSNKSNLQKIVEQVKEANPYLAETSLEQCKTTLLQLVEQISPEIEKIDADTYVAISFITYLDSKYFVPNSWCYDRQAELDDYISSMESIRTQLSRIDEDVQKIKGWDFSSLEKYRALTSK